jgi:hypothetical protein
MAGWMSACDTHIKWKQVQTYERTVLQPVPQIIIYRIIIIIIINAAHLPTREKFWQKSTTKNTLSC